VAYVVIHGSSYFRREMHADTLGDAARLAVQCIKEKRPDVRVRLPGGDILGFEDFQRAVFAGELKELRS
jgi:hypothetical protein